MKAERNEHQWNGCGSETGKDERKRGREPSRHNDGTPNEKSGGGKSGKRTDERRKATPKELARGEFGKQLNGRAI